MPEEKKYKKTKEKYNKVFLEKGIHPYPSALFQKRKTYFRIYEK
ncbi:MAG: hypothetical protein Q8P07_04595 [bacterium]|nr:hypothetical protein [bacterium]